MKIAVMGAGGIGGYVGGRLAEAGEDVHLIARGAHLAALRKDGLRVETPDDSFDIPGISATDEPADIGVADVVFFAVKLADTEAAAARLAPLIGPRTKVVTIQNGIDSADMIARYIDAGAVAAGTIYLAAYIKEPGVITFPGGFEKIHFDGQNGDPVLAGFAAACNRAKGISGEISEEPERLLWNKFVGLCAFSAITAVSRMPLGVLRENTETSDLYQQLLREGMAVARARGFDFAEDYFQAMVEIFKKQPETMKSSLLVDIEAGKPTELAWLSGRMHQLGHALDVATPAHSVIQSALSPLQAGAPEIVLS